MLMSSKFSYTSISKSSVHYFSIIEFNIQIIMMSESYEFMPKSGSGENAAGSLCRDVLAETFVLHG